MHRRRGGSQEERICTAAKERGRKNNVGFVKYNIRPDARERKEKKRRGRGRIPDRVRRSGPAVRAQSGLQKRKKRGEEAASFVCAMFIPPTPGKES